MTTDEAPTQSAPAVYALKVTNINPEVDEAVIRELFDHIGTVAEVVLTEGPPMMPTGMVMRVAFVRFETAAGCDTGLYLNQLVLLDRPVFVAKSDVFPKDKADALKLMLPPPPKPLAMMSTDPFGRVPLVVPIHIPQSVVVPPYPELAPNLEAERMDEIRRTVYCGNLASYTTAEDLKKFFAVAGEVLFCRMAGDESQPTRFAFVEFQSQDAENNAVRLSGALFFGRSVKVNHSKNAVSKPPELRSGMKGKEAAEAMRKVNSIAQRVARKKERLMLRKREDSMREARDRRRELDQEEIDRAREERRKRREADHAAADKRSEEAREMREKEREERGRDKGPEKDRDRSRSRSRSPGRARRRRSRSPDRRRSRSPRRGSRSPRRSGGGSDRKRRREEEEERDWAGRRRKSTKDSSGDEDDSKDKKGSVKIGGMRGFDD